MRRAAAFLLALVVALAVWSGGHTTLPDGRVAHSNAAFAQAAQTAELSEEDYAAWDKIAARAEDSLASGKASEAAFETLRRDLADWRSRFQDAQLVNADRIRTLRSQIESLGPLPEEGQSESEEISARRVELQATLNEMNAPVLRAEEAHAEANGLILRIDSLIRNRQRDLFFERGPSPILPSSLQTALSDLVKVNRILLAEVRSALSLRSDAIQRHQNVMTIVVLAALAFLLLLRGRPWFKKLVDWTVRKGSGSHQAMVGAMIVSLGQVVLPTIGVMLLSAALLASMMFGSNGEDLIGSLPAMGIAFFAARWLGWQTFPRHDDWPTVLELTSRQRLRGRFYASALGVLFAVAILITEVDDIFPLDAASRVVFAYPVIILASICLAGLAQLLIANGATSKMDQADNAPLDNADERSFVDRFIFIAGRVCYILAVIGPVLATIGYTRAAVVFALSPALTLCILATVSFLQRLSMGIFAMIMGPSRDPRQGLFPVLVNFALMVGAMPFIAMVWGMRRADLVELWTQAQEGVMVGETQVSPTILLVLCVAFAMGLLLTRLVQGAMRASILPRTGIDPGGQKAMISGLGYLGIFLSAMVAVSVAGLDLSNLAIVAGALSVGVGFGLQNVVSNFVSGLILLIERPVTEGDWIEVGGIMGTVKKISVRATTVETFDRTDVVVPNSDLVSNQVTNWTRGNLSGRLILPVGVAYGTDTRKVASILQEIAEAHPLVIVNPPPHVVFQGFGADSLDFEMRVILRDINFGLGTRTELNHQIAERFAAEGIEIPFAQRDIWLRNPEALRPMHVGPGQAAPIGPMRPDPDPEFPTEDDS